jgi:transcriptional regulator with XRE-family HTH domain
MYKMILVPEIQSQPPDAALLFARNFARILKETGQNPNSVAVFFDWQPRAVYNWVEGKSSPQMAKLGPLAAFLGVSIADFFTTENLPSSRKEIETLRKAYKDLVKANQLHQQAAKTLGAMLGISDERRTIDDDSDLAKHLDATRPQPGRKS